MKRASIAILAVLLSGTAALAAPGPSRIRGTISSVAPDMITVHRADGSELPISLTPDTKYLQVVKSSLDKIEQGSYIGTATKSVGGSEVALEVVVFPPAMKGVGEGHYPWDKLPDTTAPGRPATASAMTNGNVAAVAAPSMVKSAMTNGNVATASAQDGAKKLTVTYQGGEQTILVPPTASIVTLRPGAKSDLTKGAAVFIQAMMSGDKATAGAVLVGMDGVTPPM